jgi:hypothetical protein
MMMHKKKRTNKSKKGIFWAVTKAVQPTILFPRFSHGFDQSGA